jgi:transcriptional repressor NF-X1
VCHPTVDYATMCPLKPESIRACPCGNTPIATSEGESGAFPCRTSCTSPIPTCDSVCSKPLPGCEHQCRKRCHTGSCPPCDTQITLPCRCGGTLKTLQCGILSAPISLQDTIDMTEILCDKQCNALQSCGRHRCQRICCPLASIANSAVKGKNKRRTAIPAEDAMDANNIHECDRQCGRMLSCGNHRCEERDHRGNCAPCLQSSFEELFCPCGRTVVEPPVPCGTVVRCSYPCDRPRPPCGHDRVPHSCHSEDVSCPACPFLTEKLCACGKKNVGNVKCSLEREKVGCGSVCGK